MDVDFNLLAKDNPAETIREHTNFVLNNAKILETIYGMDDKLSFLLNMACEYHDYGKTSEEFQNRIKTKHSFDNQKEIPHNLLSVFFLDKKMFEDNNDYYSVAYAVLYHHYYNEDIISEYIWKKKDLVTSIVSRYGKKISKRLFEKLKDSEIVQLKNTILVKGLLHRCDFAASAHIPIEYCNDFLSEDMEKWLLNLQKENKSIHWNELQEFCKKRKENNVIVTAPTGMGKTEAALLWIGNHKGIYILPLRSAINGIFNRIKDQILNDKDIEKRLGLLYSDNINYLLNQNKNQTTFDVFEYRPRVRQLTLPLTVSTPDQLFDFVFRVPGYEMKLATAAYSKIVVDEIQAYDATMLAYIIYGIHQIMDLGGKVAIFTATLPGFVRQHLMEENHHFEYRDFSTNRIRHNLKVLNEEISSDYIIDDYMEKLQIKNSNKTLVICNTIKKAQELYQDLKDANLENVKVKILHAKYIKKDRSELEREIQEDGKTDCDKKVIWVTTQVVEASLDIDFDYLYTELSDLNGLFQRLGRCNRKGLKSCEKYNCYVFTQINPKIIMGSDENKGFIDERLYTLSKEALQQIDGKLSELEKNKIITETFSVENMNGSLFQKNYREAYSNLQQLEVNDLSKKDQKEKFRNIISYSIIPKSVYEKNRDVIENNVMFLKRRALVDDLENQNNIMEQRQRAKNEIMNFTVSVGAYDVLQKLIVDKIRISAYEVIPILDCNYDERGFMRLTKEQMDQASSYDLDYGAFL